jgi:hypothetical protein
MTRDNYDKATVSLDLINKLKAMKEKLKREFPEFEYDNQAKEIGKMIFGMIDDKIAYEQKHFDSL